MQQKDFISRAETLVEKISKIEHNLCELELCCCNIGYDVYPGLSDVIRDTIHLVYAFDKDLPLLKEIINLCEDAKRFVYPLDYDNQWTSFFMKLRKLIEYFIKYLKDYCE